MDVTTRHEPRQRLSRASVGLAEAPPVRVVHIGAGNFHRAHQAWYTSHAPDAAEWGIGGFDGRSGRVATALGPQDGLYTLITRSREGDTFELVTALAAVHAADDYGSYLDYLRRPEVSVLTMTVTEAGYVRRPDGHLDLDNDVVAGDLAALRGDISARVTSLPARLVAGLLARRKAGTGPVTLLSCDNLPHNGAVTKTVVHNFAAEVEPSLSAWMDSHVDFATSMVDRITPGTTDEDRRIVAEACGYVDTLPVATEPFSEWVVSGAFPAGRPRWEEAGVQLVDDVVPFEQRKLTLLNGAHSMLAYAGSIRGHTTIAEAINDEHCLTWVNQFWDEASHHLTLPAQDVAGYRNALLDRFSNPRAQDQLARIAADGSQKLVVRTVPTVRAERDAGRIPLGAATTLAAWVLHLRGLGAPMSDGNATAARQAANAGQLPDVVSKVLDTLDRGLGDDAELVDAVVHQAGEIQR